MPREADSTVCTLGKEHCALCPTGSTLESGRDTRDEIGIFFSNGLVCFSSFLQRNDFSPV